MQCVPGRSLAAPGFATGSTPVVFRLKDDIQSFRMSSCGYSEDRRGRRRFPFVSSFAVRGGCVRGAATATVYGVGTCAYTCCWYGGASPPPGTAPTWSELEVETKRRWASAPEAPDEVIAPPK